MASDGTRLLLKYRTFSAMALLTMALGIGSTTAVFSLIDGILIRPLSYPDPERLYSFSDKMEPVPDLVASEQVKARPSVGSGPAITISPWKVSITTARTPPDIVCMFRTRR